MLSYVVPVVLKKPIVVLKYNRDNKGQQCHAVCISESYQLIFCILRTLNHHKSHINEITGILCQIGVDLWFLPRPCLIIKRCRCYTLAIRVKVLVPILSHIIFSSVSEFPSQCPATRQRISQNVPSPYVHRAHSPTDRLSSAATRAYSRLDLSLHCGHS